MLIVLGLVCVGLFVMVTLLVFYFSDDSNRNACVMPSRLSRTVLGPKVVVMGIGYNVARAIETWRPEMNRLLRQHASDYRMVFFENGSTDGTGTILSEWGKQDGKVYHLKGQFEGRKCAREMRKGGYLGDMTKILAEYRNLVLEYVLEHYSDFDLLWIMDLDVAHLGLDSELLERIWADQRWDAVACNGQQHGVSYDALAYRDGRYPEGPGEMGEKQYWSPSRIIKVKRHMSTWPSRRFEENKWRRVHSAYGGMCFYRLKSFESSCRYEGFLASYPSTPDCEHVALNQCLQQKRNISFFVHQDWNPEKGLHVGYSDD